jgi:hypothetical protein
MLLRFFASLFSLFGAELTASWWIWARSPSDSLRAWYAGFWNFETGRLYCWVPTFAVAAILWLAAWRLSERSHDRGGTQHGNQKNRVFRAWVLSAILSLLLETLTSGLYWRSSKSADLRDLFQSSWYLHRVPQASDLGWPSFRGYLYSHLLP